jgi:hypothetical protein
VAEVDAVVYVHVLPPPQYEASMTRIHPVHTRPVVIAQ